jgi:cytoskeletal protein RodZ
MLKQAIDAYNILLDIADFIKKPTLRVKTLILGTLALIMAGCSVLSAQAFGGINADQQLLTGDDSQTQLLQQQTDKSEKPAATSKNSATTDTTASANADAGSDAARKKAAASDTKSTNSGDSTASKSFKLSVSKSGQYAAGTLIAYDAVKDDKTYYGGDLSFNISAVTVSKSKAITQANTVTISAPDGANITIPAEPSDDNLANTAISLDASQANDASNSYNMIVDINDQVQVGTYQMHVVATRTGQATGTYQYHGFITVNVVD